MPQSWSKKKRVAMDGQPHQQKPDLDNLTKSLLDALFEDDSHLGHWTSKLWGETGMIVIEHIKYS
jgi:Holliday junction resolvase RusA-like endonuclease